MNAASSAPEGQRSRQRAARRAAIIEAAVKIIATRGLSAVTHRAVAREAKVPLAATTYYFSSKEEILKEALESLSEAEVSRLSSLEKELGELEPAEALPSLAAALIGDSEEARRGWLAQFEIYLEAARHPELRPAIEQRRAAFVSLAEANLRKFGAPEPEHRAELAVAGINGILLDRVRELGDDPQATMLERLRQLFALLIQPS